jgi:Flp pilus assembly protein TadG
MRQPPIRRAVRPLGTAAAASVELALLLPIFVGLFLGLTDFSFAYHRQLQLSAVLAAAGQYAFAQGQTESGTTLANDVTSFASTVTTVPLTAITASYNGGLSASSCYCISGANRTYSAAMTCGALCTDGSGSTAGKFITISGTITYSAMFSMDLLFFANPMSQTVTVRLQ